METLWQEFTLDVIVPEKENSEQSLHQMWLVLQGIFFLKIIYIRGDRSWHDTVGTLTPSSYMDTSRIIKKRGEPTRWTGFSSSPNALERKWKFETCLYLADRTLQPSMERLKCLFLPAGGPRPAEEPSPTLVLFMAWPAPLLFSRSFSSLFQLGCCGAAFIARLDRSARHIFAQYIWLGHFDAIAKGGYRQRTAAPPPPAWPCKFAFSCKRTHATQHYVWCVWQLQ